MLLDFLRSANRNGLPVPDYDYWWMNAENDPEVLRGLHSIERWPLDRTLLQVAFAQHHGVPTRLLDWSYSPYSASWFAVSDVITALHAHDIGTAALYYGKPDDANFCIWAIDASKKHLLRTERMSLDIINPGYHLNPRINAQRGAFTLLRANEEAPENERIDHDKFVQSHLTSTHPLLVKIVAPHRIAPALLGALARHGVTRVSIYPETESVERSRAEEFFAQYIKDKVWLQTPEKNYLPQGSHHVPFYLTEQVWQDVEKCRRPKEGTFWTVHRLFRQGLHAELTINGHAGKPAAKKPAAKKPAAKKPVTKKPVTKKSAPRTTRS